MRAHLTGASLVTIAVIASCLLVACGGGGGGTTGTSRNRATSADGSRTGAAAPPPTRSGSRAGASGLAQSLPFPLIATKNTTRVDSSNPIQTAAAVALAVFPSALPGTHPAAVTLAPTNDWQAALAAASLMSTPFRAPLLLSTPGRLPSLTARALALLAPQGARAAAAAQVIRVGDVARPAGYRAAAISGSDPYSLAAAIDRFEIARRRSPSRDVIIASATQAPYAMPAAGLSAESGDPILYVAPTGVPVATGRALLLHHHPHIYVLGPSSVVPDAILSKLAAYGRVARVGAAGPAANSVALAAYRDPPCAYAQPCVQIPGSFGWAIRSPGHGYVLISDSQPLDAAAAAALSSSGSYGPQLLVENANTLAPSVLTYFLNYATPGYAQEGPTSAVYNHAWLIGTANQISLQVQAQIDSLLEAVPQR